MRHKIRLILTSLAMLLFAMVFSGSDVRAAETKYGILIGDKKGNYSFYDINGDAKDQNIEITSGGDIMIPLKLVCSYLPEVDYSFDFTARKATLVNKANGKKLVFTENKKTVDYYSKASSKAVKKNMSYKMYLSAKSNAAMVHRASLQWILTDTGGYRFYGKTAIQKAGYDGADYGGIIIYHPFQKVTSLPKAVSVSYRPRKIEGNLVTVTVPEGYSAAKTFALLAKKGVSASTKALYQAGEKEDFRRFPLIAGQKPGVNRCFRLEGYLYPDTYQFYKNSSPKEILDKFLSNAENKITPMLGTKAAELNYTPEEVLKLASIVEKEAGKKQEMDKVASVLSNRLNSNMKLQCDATIHYVEKYIKPYIDGDKNRYNEDYNTYKCKALPAGPICSPSANAINAVLHPLETDYLYFLTDAQGSYYYAATWEEHLENKRAAGLN